MQEECPGFTGIWIPREIWFAKELSFTEKALLMQIHQLGGFDDSKGCYATNAYFSDFLQISTRNVQVHLTKLKDLNYIKSAFEDPKTRSKRKIFTTIRLNIGGDEIDTPTHDDPDTPPGDAIDTRKANSLKQKNIPPLVVPPGVDADAWGALDEYRRNKKKSTWTEKAQSIAANKLSQHPPDVQRNAVNDTIESGWTGVFPKAYQNDKISNRSNHGRKTNGKPSAIALYEKYYPGDLL